MGIVVPLGDLLPLPTGGGGGGGGGGGAGGMSNVFPGASFESGSGVLGSETQRIIISIPRCKMGTRYWSGQSELTPRIHYVQVTESTGNGASTLALKSMARVNRSPKRESSWHIKHCLLVIKKSQCKSSKLGGRRVNISVADPGFPVGGRGPRRGVRGPPKRLHFENFACQNERIWTRRGGAPPRSANVSLRLVTLDCNFFHE